MNETDIQIGATVVNSDRVTIGRVEQVSDGAIRVKRGDRFIDIPFDNVDLQQSSVSKVILTPDFELTGKMIEVRSEELHTDIVEVERGRIRIDKSLERVPFAEDVELGTDVVDIERIPGGQEFDEMPQPRQEGGTLIIPVVEEVVVISRRYRVVEEVHVTTHREMHTEHVREELRKEVVSVREVESDDHNDT